MRTDTWLAISLSLVGSANVWADYPTIHVTWADSPGPVESRDYVICDSSPCDPDLPSIELITSSLTWQIWSTDPDNTGGIGDIGTITCPYPQNFAVKLLNDSDGPGARTVKGIILDPSNAANYSSLVAGELTGDLDGDLLLQQASGGSGGALTGLFIVAGELTGAATIPVIDGGYLQVGALDAGASIAISNTMLNNAQLDTGDVPDAVTVTINNLEDTSRVGIATMGGSCTGLITMTSGISDESLLGVRELLYPGVIDLNGQNVEGGLVISEGGDGTILDGGVVSGTVNLTAYNLHGPWFTFAGHAYFDSIAGSASLDASVEVLGHLPG